MNKKEMGANPEIKLQIDKFHELSRAVRSYLIKVNASDSDKNSEIITELADNRPVEAIEHLREGINLPPLLTYESQLANLRDFLDQHYDEPFNVEDFKE